MCEKDHCTISADSFVLGNVFVFRNHGSQMLHYNSSIDLLLLEVNVSNTPTLGRPAEDAHNTMLNISIPPSLSYSGVRTEVVTLRIYIIQILVAEKQDNDEIEHNLICIEFDIMLKLQIKLMSKSMFVEKWATHIKRSRDLCFCCTTFSML